MMLIDENDTLSHREAKEACKKMDSFLEIVMDVLTIFLEFYTKNREHRKSRRILSEMEKIEEGFYTALEAAREYLNSHRDDSSSLSSEILTINLQQVLKLDASPDTHPKEHIPAEHLQTLAEVNFSRQ